MEIAAQSLSPAKLSKPPTISIFHSRPSLFASSNINDISNTNYKNISLNNPTQINFNQGLKLKLAAHHKNYGIVFASSEAQTPSADVTDRWLLQPIGDGDSRHIGYKVKMPNAFEIASDEVTVGRLPDKADLVIPVATVSAQHARIKKKEENLLITDLDSTNGTFIDDKRLAPGVAAVASAGTVITFGDIHLAMFRVSKLEPAVEATSNSEGAKAESADSPSENTN